MPDVQHAKATIAQCARDLRAKDARIIVGFFLQVSEALDTKREPQPLSPV